MNSVSNRKLSYAENQAADKTQLYDTLRRIAVIYRKAAIIDAPHRAFTSFY